MRMRKCWTTHVGSGEMKQVVAAVAWDDGCYREPIQQQRSLRCDAAAQLNSALGFMKFEGYGVWSKFRIARREPADWQHRMRCKIA